MWCARHRLRVLWSVLSLGAGALLFARVLGRADWRGALLTASGLGAPLLLLLALPAVSNFIKMLGWRSLLPPSARPELGRAYAAFVAAQGINELGFAVLGEPLKVLVLAPGERQHGLRAVLADNLAALAALLAVLATLSRFSLSFAPLFGIALVALQGERRWRAWLGAFSAHYFGKLWLVVEIGLGLHFLGQPAARAAAPLTLAWLGAAAVGSPVPGQLGVVEAALVQVGQGLGLALPSLLALGLIRRLRGVLWSLLGLLLAARIAAQSGAWRRG